MPQRQLHQRKHDTAASSCLMLLVTVIFLASACSAAAKHHNHKHSSNGGGLLQWDHRGGRRVRGKDGGGGEPGRKHHQEDDNVISRPGERSSTAPGGPRRRVLLHEAVRKLLGFESSPGLRRRGRKSHGPQLLPDPLKPPPMPKYVLDLYNKYRSGEMMHSPDLGNTVRSIPAEIGVVNGEAMFIFNLSSVASTERVMRAHVHLYKRRKSSASQKRNRRRRGGRRRLRLGGGGGGGGDGDDTGGDKARLRHSVETELVLYEVAPHYLSQAGSITMRSSARGWQWYGATDAVLGCLAVDREHPHLFALSFRAEKPNGKVRTLALKRFVRHHSMPFLILYSNETESVNLQEVDIVAERLMLKERRDSSSSSVHNRRGHYYYSDDEVYANYDYDEDEDDFEDEEDEDADIEKEDGTFGENDFDYYDYEDEEKEDNRTGGDDSNDGASEESSVDWFKGFGRNRHRKKKLHKSSNHDKKFGHHHKKHNKHNKKSKTDNDKFISENANDDSNPAESSEDTDSSSTEKSDIITDSAVVTTVVSTHNASSREANKLREPSGQQNHSDSDESRDSDSGESRDRDSGESRDRDNGESDSESRGESPRNHDEADSRRGDGSESRENSHDSDRSQLSDNNESQHSDNNGELPPLQEEQGQDIKSAVDLLLLQTPAAERMKRNRRSILTNEIPEDVSAEEFPNNFHYRFNKLPQTHPGMLTARKDPRRKNHHRGVSEASSSSRTIPYPAERRGSNSKSQRRRRKHRRRQNRRRRIRKNRRRRLPLPEEWEDYHNLATPDNNPGQVCSRRRLVVDFADIGWGDWIISPKSFEAHYCAGTCPFPLTKKLRPSNHATIQSIVNAIGMYSNVPAPCCVPDTMTSVTLLYFDENRNVVLKNYPGMSVQSCACR